MCKALAYAKLLVLLISLHFSSAVLMVYTSASGLWQSNSQNGNALMESTYYLLQHFAL